MYEILSGMMFLESAKNWTEGFSYPRKELYHWTTFLDLLYVWDKVFLYNLKLMNLLPQLPEFWIIGISSHL